MRKLLILFLLSFTFISKAQTNWPPIGAEWYYNYDANSMTENTEGKDGYLHLYASKDTVLNDTSCTKIEVTYHSENGALTNLGNEFLFSSGDSVFSYHHGTFHLLYDFSKKIGDNVQFNLGSNCSLYQKLGNYSSVFYGSVPYNVKSKDSVKINGINYVEMEYNLLHVESSIFIDHSGGKIIKGIGSLQFLTGRVFPSIEVDNFGPLRCYSDGTISYSNGTPCDYLPTEIESNEESGLVQIMQNPATETLSLRINEQAISIFQYLEIIDITGTILFQQKVEGSEMSIPVSNLPNGVYMYKVVGEETVSGMFVKE